MNYGKQVEKYLKKIDEGKAIDYAQFLNLLNSPELNLDATNRDFEVRRVGTNTYKVTRVALWLRVQLDNIIGEIYKDRNSAAKQNNSHAYNVNGSMLLVREGAIHPQVVMFDTDGNYLPKREWHDYALLIENRQNFISIDKTLSFIKTYCDIGDVDLQKALTVFTEGNAISNALHLRFLCKFKSIFLLLDVDAGGLQIASNLLTLLPNSNVVFLVPSDIKDRLKTVRAPAKTISIEKAIRLGRKHPELTHVAQLIYKTERELEQESYLDE
ncbi:hypothetical protein L0668_11780 [Paraglaciecola aquimarina]|uniref:Wadjet protein JetD C-terminal domain-containing protein n=1 Tax=Paraglaciecola algarum TaxID=3050085 RepID=A0ABS9D7M6_9ALTE|nr:hypothetical protein [Paraglaciecola sp. G1-23]MCF2948790.1 hypothetical protein [Paraglaciecola sp. G1-23]